MVLLITILQQNWLIWRQKNTIVHIVNPHLQRKEAFSYTQNQSTKAKNFHAHIVYNLHDIMYFGEEASKGTYNVFINKIIHPESHSIFSITNDQHQNSDC